MAEFNHNEKSVVVQSVSNYGRKDNEHVGADGYQASGMVVGALDILTGDKVIATYAPGKWDAVIIPSSN
ncbi:hypothetical protein ACTXJX_12705 [Glutamicibacter ardleyensis]|uniref:hypothetical protein n=1 Tax=Glutamicibacter ardleyensis TaxID=225894 RepID=UPI003FD2F34B